MKVESVSPPFFNLIWLVMFVEQKIAEVISAPLKNKDIELVKVTYSNKNLQIFIEKIDGAGVSIKDCEIASKLISTILDVEDLIKENYNLEVSSPGLDRPLTKIEDFIRFADKQVKLSLKEKVLERKKIKGTIKAVENNKITIDGDFGLVEVNFDIIASANLIPQINFNK